MASIRNIGGTFVNDGSPRREWVEEVICCAERAEEHRLGHRPHDLDAIVLFRAFTDVPRARVRLRVRMRMRVKARVWVWARAWGRV